MTVPVNAILRGVATLDIDARSKAQNVFHFTHISAETKTDVQVVTAFKEYCLALYETMATYISDNVNLEKVELFERVLGDWEPIGVDTTTWVGDATGKMGPAGIALLVHAFKQRTGYSDKKFLAGITEANLDGDLWLGPVLAAAQDFADEWIESFTGTDSVVLLPIHYNAVLEVAKTYINSAPAALISYQRRRKPGVGLT